MTVASLRDFLRAAGDTCEICGIGGESTSKGLCIDHDHALDTTRGLLCSNCNSILGHSQDNQRILAKSIEYLSKYKLRDAQFVSDVILSENEELQEDSIWTGPP
mgnify:CR=1 FL=1